MVCNGFEIASGSIRNQSPETMVKAFEIVGWRRRRRGALRRHLPRLPVRRAAAWRHGGRHRPHRHAAGGAQNLREITLFPMNQQAEDLLMGAPSRRRPSSCANST
jgi:aspartyl-tRNA synthetase